MADYHALIKCDDPARVARSRLEIAATWLAVGLDPERVTFYRQSDIPEIPELCWVLNCVTAKGLMNRAHAYKASVDQNEAKGVEPDDGVTMGLFSYPVLMAADILMFNAHKVPVGRDQIQHLEMARDIAQRFNHQYGRDYFTLPEVTIEEEVATLPGLDGRKMSKSYNNTIPLFEWRAGAARLGDAHRDRFARAGRTQGRREFAPVHDLPRFRDAGSVRRVPQAAGRGHGLGRCQAVPAGPSGTAAGADARKVLRPDGQPRSHRRSVAPARRRRASWPRRLWPNCARPLACAI